MESRILILILAALFSEYALFFILIFLGLEVFSRYKKHKKKERLDKMSLELLYLLSSEKHINEKIIAKLMRVVGLVKWANMYEHKGKLVLPIFGWRSKTSTLAIKSYLDTSNPEILTDALFQISKQEEYALETSSLLSSQKYTLMASLVVASAVLGVVSSMTGENYLWYVVSQAVVSGIWLGFFENKFYESLSFSIPSSILAYLLSLRLV
ncbi:MAG: hypothetical protein GOU98_03240 [Candidatus Altiarchaeota archaeon]|nr:hypothetical protein [Candidatus Altiarchaeota archaeon]